MKVVCFTVLHHVRSVCGRSRVHVYCVMSMRPVNAKRPSFERKHAAILMAADCDSEQTHESRATDLDGAALVRADRGTVRGPVVDRGTRAKRESRNEPELTPLSDTTRGRPSPSYRSHVTRARTVRLRKTYRRERRRTPCAHRGSHPEISSASTGPSITTRITKGEAVPSVRTTRTSLLHV